MSREQQEKRREMLDKTTEHIELLSRLERYKIALQRIAFGGFHPTPRGYKDGLDRAMLIANEALEEYKPKPKTLEVGKVYRSADKADTWAVIAERRGQFICVNSCNVANTFDAFGMSTDPNIMNIVPEDMIGEDDGE